MATHDVRPSSSISSAEPGEGSGALIRLGWMIGGSLTMLCAWFTILNQPPWTFGIRDAVFWSGALLALAMRYLDITRFRGQTSRGEVATMAHFWRYAVGLSVIASSAWTLAQAVRL